MRGWRSIHVTDGDHPYMKAWWVPGLQIGGKPQCRVIALAKEQGQVAASLGCTLSRTRTSLPGDEMTCAIPGNRLAEVVCGVEATARSDAVAESYAAADIRRFAER